jgi:hypothetical protein
LRADLGRIDSRLRSDSNKPACPSARRGEIAQTLRLKADIARISRSTALQLMRKPQVEEIAGRCASESICT